MANKLSKHERKYLHRAMENLPQGETFILRADGTTSVADTKKRRAMIAVARLGFEDRQNRAFMSIYC